jgi:hypothetical protein
MREVVSPRRDEVMNVGRKLQYEEFHNLYSSCDNVGMTKSRMITWTEWRELKFHAKYLRKHQ